MFREAGKSRMELACYAVTMWLDLRDGDETQRIQYTARRAEIREALHPEPPRDYSLESYDDEGEKESGTNCSTLAKPKTGRGNIQFAAETAALTGQSKRDINRQLAVGKAIGPARERWLAQLAPTSAKRYSRALPGTGAMRARASTVFRGA